MRWRVALGGIVLAGLAWRLVYAYAMVRNHPLLGDAAEFHQQANLLADGHGYIDPFYWAFHHLPKATADKPPVYPFLEAFVSLLGGRSWQAHDLVGILSGTATIVVVALVARRLAGPRAGLIAAAIAAAYPMLVAADGALRSESTYALLVTLSLLCALRLRERRSLGRAAALGAVIGLAALTRGEALLLVVLVALPAARWRTREAAVAVAACAVVLAPWLVRCWTTFDEPVAISTNTGGLLAGANCHSTYHGEFIGQWDFRCVPEIKKFNEAQAADELRRVGVRYARDHAGRLPVVLAVRLGRSFELYRPLQGVNIERFLEGRDLTAEKAGLVMYYLLALLGIAGAVVLRRRRDGSLSTLLAPIVGVVFVSLTAYGITRFRVGAEPALVILATVGAEAMVLRLRSRSALRR